MKRKILSILLVLTIVFPMDACSVSNDPKQESAQDIPTTEKNMLEDSENLVTKKYCGLSFELPIDAEYSEGDSSATIIFEPKKKVAVIVPTSTSELDSTLKDSWNIFAISSALNAYDEVQNREDFDMTISEVSAKAATATIKLSNSWFSLSVISFINEDNQYQYSISYLVDENSGEDNSDYESFIESISFN